MRRALLLIGIAVLVLAAVFAQRARAQRSDRWRAAANMTGGNPHLGRQKIRDYGCYTCHTIPGVRGAAGLVGPPLTNIGSRVFLAGELPNTPDNLELWIQHPHKVEPHTAMPEMGVTEQDSRDIAAYLYTLR